MHDGVRARTAQPARHEVVQVSRARALPALEEVGHGGVAEPVAGEVVAHAGEERLVPDLGIEQPQHARALVVGDAVEVLERGGGVLRPVPRDGMGARALVGHQAPLPPGVGVVDPRVAELGDVRGHPGAEVLRERLVEPQVVPPARGGDVAEPHVGHLVRHRGRPGDPLASGDLAGEDHRVPERHAAGILHGPRVELGDERLVVRPEGVPDPEQPVELGEALPGEREQLLRVRVEVAGDALPAGQPERDAVVGVGEHVPWPGDERDEVRRQRRAPVELPPSRVHGTPGGVGDDGPAGRER